ncbi:MAG: CAP domain-containing protein, partial [candidate division KSB1 bacterium]|nr:CAP domain-containing protein [candidate division KSB1 bacterium]
MKKILRGEIVFITFILFLLQCTTSRPELYLRSDLPRLLQENDSLLVLNEYKDTEQMLELKLRNLELINKSRKKEGLPPVALDILASRVANKHCQEMAEQGYISHWNTKGEKPYHRYALAGGTHAIVENIHVSVTTGYLERSSEESKLEYMNQGHLGFMAEKPPFDGHRKNILDPHHNAVGIGCYLSEKGLAYAQEKRFAYAQEFLNKYLQMDTFPRKIQAGQTVTFSGKIMEPNLYPFLLLVYYEPCPRPMSVLELQNTSSYPDFTDTQYKTLWNQFWLEEKTQRFKINLTLEGAKPGLYYVKIYLSKKKGRVYNSEDGFP